MYLNGKEVLITGGSGSLGNALTELLIKNYKPKGIRIYSRGEMLQYEMKKKFADSPIPISYLIGDVRDLNRLRLACKGVNIIIHAAALKQITVCNNNPIEAISTNIYGTQNVILAAIDNDVEKAMFISTDKAVEPWTLYGSTKKSAESLFINANIYSGGRYPRFSCCRYGNIISSRGSVIPLFRKQAAKGELTITHPEMTRFFMSLPMVAQFILDRIPDMKCGEIYIPTMKSLNILDLAKFIAPSAKIKIIGIRSDEKIHEILVAPNEKAKIAYHSDGYYVISDQYRSKNMIDFEYSSGSEDFLKSPEYFRKLI
jgi:FlaA1/EpsC-like NDP-sugar epimerase